ncbi:hypothetical protein [Aquamicrobium ahrensii]|uniref:Bacteriophage tail tape measure C-terminal domain-containing protein n=1 Tax=Aquamicrobium ahrensii TaxID=469551 RepID=A0ABV2KN54_9HYPH
MAKGSVIGNLRVNMGLDSAQFQTGLASVSKNMDAMAKEAAAFGAKIGLAISGAVAGIGAFVKMTASSAAKMGDVADRLGLPVESLQELRHAADMSGVAVQNFDVAFRRFIRRSSEAARGTGAAKDAFKELGVSLTDNQKRMRNSEDIFNDVADAMGKIKDPANRLRLAFKMFDTDGAAMVKMFENGSAGVKQFREQAQQLGIVLSEDAVRSSQRFNDSLSLISKTAEGFKNRVFAGILPAFENLAARILDISVNGQVMDGVVNALSGGMNLLARGIGFVLDNLDHLVDLFKVFVAAKIVTYVAAVGGAMLTLGRTVGIASKAMLLLTSITRVKITTLALLAGVIAKVTGTYDVLVEKLKSVGQAVLDALPEDMRSSMEGLGQKLKDLVADVNEANSESAKMFGSYLGWSDEAVDSFGRVGTAAKSAADKMKEMQSEAARIFEATRTPLEQYQAQIARLNELLAAGAINQDTYNRAVIQAQDAFEQAEKAGLKTESVFQQIGQTIAQSFGSAMQGLIDRSKKAIDVLKDLLSQLASMAMNRAFQALLGSIGGSLFGGSDPWAGLRVPNFASGGTIMPGGYGGIDSQLVMFRKSPNERVDITKPGQTLEGGRGGAVSVAVEVFVNDDGMLGAIAKTAGRDAAVSVVQANNKARQKLYNNGGNPR